MNEVRDIMIRNVYHIGNLSPTCSENKHLDEQLSVDTHEKFSHVSAALSDAPAHHVLLGNFNIHYSNWGGPVYGLIILLSCYSHVKNRMGPHSCYSLR
jgi:hypothetical protein